MALLLETEGRIERWQRRAEEQSALHTRQEWRMQQQRQHLWEEPIEHCVTTRLRQEHALGSELEAVQGTHITLAELLDGAQVVMGDRPMTEERIEFLGRDGSSRQCDVHPDCPGGTHGVRRITNEQ
jgi:hypothetical protein